MCEKISNPLSMYNECVHTHTYASRALQGVRETNFAAFYNKTFKVKIGM